MFALLLSFLFAFIIISFIVIIFTIINIIVIIAIVVVVVVVTVIIVIIILSPSSLKKKNCCLLCFTCVDIFYSDPREQNLSGGGNWPQVLRLSPGPPAVNKVPAGSRGGQRFCLSPERSSDSRRPHRRLSFVYLVLRHLPGQVGRLWAVLSKSVQVERYSNSSARESTCGTDRLDVWRRCVEVSSREFIFRARGSKPCVSWRRRGSVPLFEGCQTGRNLCV